MPRQLIQHAVVGTLCVFCSCGPKTLAESGPVLTYNLADHLPPDGKADATAALGGKTPTPFANNLGE